MTNENLRFIVPIRVLEGQTVQPQFAKLLRDVGVVLAGIVELPEQTPPEQAQMQFRDQATEKLNETADVFEDEGVTVDQHLVFTQNRQETLTRLIRDHGAQGYIRPNPVDDIENVLIPVRDDTNPIIVERIARTVVEILGTPTITLLRIGSEEDESVVRRQLIEQGVPADKILTDEVASLDISGRISEKSTDYDAVVLVREQTALSVLFGSEDERVARRSLGPVFVISDEVHAETEE